LKLKGEKMKFYECAAIAAVCNCGCCIVEVDTPLGKIQKYYICDTCKGHVGRYEWSDEYPVLEEKD
jgi:hypothetical protein